MKRLLKGYMESVGYILERIHSFHFAKIQDLKASLRDDNIAWEYLFETLQCGMKKFEIYFENINSNSKESWMALTLLQLQILECKMKLACNKLNMNFQLTWNCNVSRRATRGGWGGRPPLSFFENQKNCFDFRKKMSWLCPSLA